MSPHRGEAAKRLLWAGALGGCLAASAGCASADPLGSSASAIVTSSDVTIDVTAQYQRITGFGASSAWTGGSISEERADQFFSVEKGLGLSLLRMHITPDGDSAELSTARLAAARGVSVWASPWSPPGAWKTSGTDNHGGSLLPEYYQDWADRLAGFASSMKKAGVPLVALSAQNEPNWSADWETCVYSPGELVTFVAEYLAPALERESPDTKLLGPENIDWTTLKQYADPLLADEAAREALDIVAVHAYGGTPYAYSAPADHDKEFWQTEVSYDDNTGQLAALQTAREIQKHLVVGGVNAFHYWWLTSDTSGALMQKGELLPQAYALGQYSKFIRPGYVRVDVPSAPKTGVSSSAYYDPESHRTVLVLVNENSDDVTLDLRVEGTAPLEVRPWVTNESESLSPRPPMAFENPFSYVFGAQSVTSLVFTETVEPVEAGEGGAGGAPASSTGGTSSSNGSDGDEAAPEAEAGADSGSGGHHSSNGANGSAAGSDPTSIAPAKRGSYMACSTRAPARNPAPIAVLAAGALFVTMRRRRRS